MFVLIGAAGHFGAEDRDALAQYDCRGEIWGMDTCCQGGSTCVVDLSQTVGNAAVILISCFLIFRMCV